MSTETTLQLESASLEETLELAKKIGSRLKGGEVIELISDLGGGKTAFVSGLAEGMGSEDSVSSPSFTLNNLYKTDSLELHHFDFYRLDEPGVLKDEIAELLREPNVVVAVEWADIIQEILPISRLSIKLTPTGNSSRKIQLNCPSNLSYLLKGLA